MQTERKNSIALCEVNRTTNATIEYRKIGKTKSRLRATISGANRDRSFDLKKYGFLKFLCNSANLWRFSRGFNSSIFSVIHSQRLVIFCPGISEGVEYFFRVVFQSKSILIPIRIDERTILVDQEQLFWPDIASNSFRIVTRTRKGDLHELITAHVLRKIPSPNYVTNRRV